MTYEQYQMALRIAEKRYDVIQDADYKGVNNYYLMQLGDFIQWLHGQMSHYEDKVLVLAEQEYRQAGGDLMTYEESINLSRANWARYKAGEGISDVCA